jgi:hypothetical protein
MDGGVLLMSVTLFQNVSNLSFLLFEMFFYLIRMRQNLTSASQSSKVYEAEYITRGDVVDSELIGVIKGCYQIAKECRQSYDARACK